MPTYLSKSAFLKRVSDRANSRYGSSISEAWLNDLIKDGLVPELERRANIGRTPTYVATAHHYRRTLQIKRIHSRGIKSRDAIAVQLFIRGYGLKAPFIMQELRREYIKHVRSLAGKLRSGYFDNTRDVSPAHMSSLSKQMGPLDPRLEAFRQSNYFYLHMTRGALSPHLQSPFGSLLAIDPEAGALSEDLEAAFRSPPETFEMARLLFAAINQVMLKPVLANDLIDSEEFAAFCLSATLFFVASGFTTLSVFDKISRQADFKGRMDNLLDAMRLFEPKSGDTSGQL